MTVGQTLSFPHILNRALVVMLWSNKELSETTMAAIAASRVQSKKDGLDKTEAL